MTPKQHEQPGWDLDLRPVRRPRGPAYPHVVQYRRTFLAHLGAVAALLGGALVGCKEDPRPLPGTPTPPRTGGVVARPPEHLAGDVAQPAPPEHLAGEVAPPEPPEPPRPGGDLEALEPPDAPSVPGRVRMPERPR